jgi:tetratricopeptide (TPR) repeat protein
VAGAAELNGLYRWGSAQTLTVKTLPGGKVEGFLSSTGSCGLDRSRPVLTGEWEGDVLVGEVTLCQMGAGCGPAQYAFLGFYNASDGSLTADLELETSCELPALSRDGRLIIEPVARGAGDDSSISSPAMETRRLGAHTSRGQQLLHEEDAEGARREFHRALERREDAASAYHGLALVEVNQQHWERAVRYYRRSLEVRSDPVVYYNLACAYGRLRDKRNALVSLKLAVDNGFARDDALAQEEDLLPLLGKDPEFHALLAKLQAKHTSPSAPARTADNPP